MRVQQNARAVAHRFDFVSPDALAPLRRVSIAYRGSMASAKATERFVPFRLRPDCALRIVSFDEGGQNARRQVDGAANHCRAHGFQVESDAAPGLPKQRLPPYAEAWNADPTGVGSSARSVLFRRAFGETSLRVIRNAHRPLVLAQCPTRGRASADAQRPAASLGERV